MAGLAVAPAASLLRSGIARAQQNYPNRPIRLIIPFGAGGIADITSRLVAEKLGERLGQRIVIENQPGAGGVTAARSVLSSAADGYTLALLTNGTAISVPLFKSLPFDPLADFVPVSTFAFFDFIFAVNAASEYRTLGDVIAAARAKPGSLNFGTDQCRQQPEPVRRTVQVGGGHQFRYRAVSQHPGGVGGIAAQRCAMS